MVISNLKIGTSYFFTLLKEFAKENIRYLLFLVVVPEIPVLALDVLFFALLVPYVKLYYGLENGVQRLYDAYEKLEKL